MYRGGPTLDGSSSGNISLPLSVLWKYTSDPTPNNPSSVTVSGGVVYYGCGKRIFAVKADTGAMLWRYPTDAPMSTVINGTPALDAGTLFIGTESGRLLALNAANGNVNWEYDVSGGIGGSPIVDNGVVYFGSGNGKLYAVDAKTGNPMPGWKSGFTAGDEISGAPAVANGFVYAISLDQVLHAISATTGLERWYIRLPASVLHISPVVSGDRLYCASGSNLYCFLAQSGARLWMVTMPADIASTPTINSHGLYVVTTDDKVYAFDPSRGNPLWHAAASLHYDTSAPATVSGRLLFMGTDQGVLYAIDTTTGQIKWSYLINPSALNANQVPTYASIAAPPVVSDNTLFIVSDDGTLTAFTNSANYSSMPPRISDLIPEMGTVINGTPPIKISAKIVDYGSGVDPESVVLSLDGHALPKRPSGFNNQDKPGYHYEMLTGVIKYETPVTQPIRPLADGRHIITVTAKDWAGNSITKSWSFVVDNSLSRQAPEPQNRRNRYPGYPGYPGGSGMPGMPNRR